eukprot:TRINITY_DN37914_c0_g1_i1.p1 TRINITY_DN37914_c0_g1~~TRINITY_DN37914_c0_g1_i1.p1  ORF type:complete len:1392 (+),score=310.31 TRINITY_DN37914_c0_g1_i1:200-4177(+)
MAGANGAIVPHKGQPASAAASNQVATARPGSRQEAYLSPAPEGRRKVSVLEMMEFCKSLDIDPVKESEMLWIAEEAYHAKLPLGWSEHVDENGHTYFHHLATGESKWQHPMDDLFRDIVEYYRTTVRTGGFWTVEDELAQLEEKIRKDLGKWMELFDDRGGKYYYNNETEVSMFDDPRNEMYHHLYTRIKMVAKMKERMPLLARAPRPETLTLLQQRALDEQEQAELRFTRAVISIQGFARILAAKARAGEARARRNLGKGPQPLKPILRLRLEAVGALGKKEVVLAHTTPHRRNAAATKIQARARTMLARMRVQPMIVHRRFLHGEARKIQVATRRHLKKREAERRYEQGRDRAARLIQRNWRGYKARKYVGHLREDKKQFERMVSGITKIQTRVRIIFAKKEMYRRKVAKYVEPTIELQRQIRVHQARKRLMFLLPGTEPIQCHFHFTTDPRHVNFMPVSFRVLYAPTDESGVITLRGHNYHDLLGRRGAKHADDVAAETIQKYWRIVLAKRFVEMRRQEYNARTVAAEKEKAKTHEIRTKSATKIQARMRGCLIRKWDIIGQRRKAWKAKNAKTIGKVQAYMKRFAGQNHFLSDTEELMRKLSAIRIQKCWRGWLARRQCEILAEQALWPVKGCFDFIPTGPSTCYVSVQFLPNPRFDCQKHILAHCDMDMLGESINLMESEVNTCVDNYLKTVEEMPVPEEPAESRRPSVLPEGAERQGSRAGSIVGSAAGSGAGKNDAAESAAAEGSTVAPAGDATASAGEAPAPAEPVVATEAGATAVEPAPAAAEGQQASPPPPGSAAGEGSAVAGSSAPVAAPSDAPAPSADAASAPPAEAAAAASNESSMPPQTEDAAQPNAEQSAPAVEASEKVAEAASAADVAQAPVDEPVVAADTAVPIGEDPAVVTSARVSSARAPSAAEPAAAEPVEVSEQEPPLVEQPLVEPPAAEDAQEEFKPLDPNEQVTPAVTGAPFASNAESMDETVQNFYGAGNAQKVLREAAADIEAEAPGPSQPPTAPRKHYAGQWVNGKFERTKATSLEDLSPEEKQQVLNDIEEVRRQKVAELVRRQKKHAAKQKKDQRREVAKFHINEDATKHFAADFGQKKAEEMKKWLKRKTEDGKAKSKKEAEAMQHLMDKKAAQKEAAERYGSQLQADRERRLRLAEQRRDFIMQTMAMRGPPAGGYFPGQPQEMMAPTMAMPPMAMPQNPRMMHRHVHHHMHYHGGAESGPEDPMARTHGSMGDLHGAAEAPRMPWSKAAPPLGAMRRAQSDVVIGPGAPLKQRPLAPPARGPGPAKSDDGYHGGGYHSSFQTALGSYGARPRVA